MDLAGDVNFRNWILSLRPMANNARSSAIGSVVARMKEGGEEEDIIEAMESLMEQDVYDAAEKTIRAQFEMPDK